jgi:hypothetical protein
MPLVIFYDDPIQLFSKSAKMASLTAINSIKKDMLQACKPVGYEKKYPNKQ